MRERMAGGRRAFYSLTPHEKSVLNSTAQQLYDIGSNAALAVSMESIDKRGFIYAVTHPSWAMAVKIGRAYCPIRRLASFQTGCPRRAYQLEHAVYFHDSHEAERAIHEQIGHLRLEGEWFAVTVDEAINTINLIEEIISCGQR
jgi:hypothetical protein